MVSVSTRTISSIGIGKKDYSINISNSVATVNKGHFARSISSGRWALPGIYCGLVINANFTFIETYDPSSTYTIAPETTTQFFDWWAEIIPANSFYAHFASWETYDAYANDSWLTPTFYEDFGGGYSTTGLIDERISKGIRSKKGLIYGIRCVNFDPLAAAFTLFVGMASIRNTVKGA